MLAGLPSVARTAMLRSVSVVGVRSVYSGRASLLRMCANRRYSDMKKSGDEGATETSGAALTQIQLQLLRTQVQMPMPMPMLMLMPRFRMRYWPLENRRLTRI